MTEPLKLGDAVVERRPLRWVRQEDAEGCSLAVLAMLTGESYADVKTEVDAYDSIVRDWDKSGVAYFTLDRFLVRRGFALQRVYESWVSDRLPWPPAPWAPLHFASVKQPTGNGHFVVMDAAGCVFDPLREGTFKLTDWPGVNNVVALHRSLCLNDPEMVEQVAEAIEQVRRCQRVGERIAVHQARAAIAALLEAGAESEEAEDGE